jgi:hypothetical protein
VFQDRRGHDARVTGRDQPIKRDLSGVKYWTPGRM